jgi:hypothetical protein
MSSPPNRRRNPNRSPSSPRVKLVLEPGQNITEIHNLDPQLGLDLFGIPVRNFTEENGHTRVFSDPIAANKWASNPDVTIVPTCRLSEVKSRLKEAGLNYRLLPLKPVPVQPEVEWAVGESHFVREMVGALWHYEVGRIQVSRNKFLEAVKYICTSFPLTNVVVVVPRKKNANEYRVELNKLEPRRATRTANAISFATQRVHICTPMEFRTTDPSVFDVVVVVDVSKCLGEEMMHGLFATTFHRIYALEDKNKKLDEFVRIKAVHIAGDVIFNEDHVDQAPKFLWICRTQSVASVNHTSARERKRLSIFENAPRNQVIARLARSLTAGTRVPGLNLPLAMASRPLGVAILVESPEHARHLHALLSDWTVLSRGQLLPVGGIHRTIMTQMWANEQQHLPVDVLIRAEGDMAPLELRYFKLGNKNRIASAFVIDLADIANSAELEMIYREDGYKTIMRSE